MATIIKDLGPVSAYAYAVTQGYTGTEEEFAQEMADLADVSAEAETLEPDEEATASYEGGVLSFGIPKGDKGDTGETGATGATGATGNGIASIAKTGTSGLVDTYTITFTDGTTSTFTVTNGTAAIDATLSIAGRAADAKATGDEISDLKSDLNVSIEAIAFDNRILIKKLTFSNGYWNTSGVLTDSTTTFHTDKISVIPNRQYYVEFPATTTKVIMRNFNSDGTVASSYERTSSGIFTPTTGTIAFNAIGNAKNDDIYLFDASSNLTLKDDTLVSRGIVSSGTVALSDYTEQGWYLFYRAVNVTDRPPHFYTGGFVLLVLRVGTVAYQIVYPLDYKRWAYRVVGSSWVEPYIPNYYDGKKISIIGDSLSDKANSTAATRYYDIVDQRLGTVSTEYAQSGCGYKRKYNNGNAFYEQALQINSNTDLVLIFGSFNDHNVYDTDGLGAVTDTTTDTVFGCVYTTLQNIFATAPKALVGIILPTPWAQYPPYVTNTLQWEYVNGIKEIAKRYSIPVLDLYAESNMRPWDATFRTNFYKENDVQDSGTHPSSAGHARFAPKVVSFVESILTQSV